MACSPSLQVDIDVSCGDISQGLSFPPTVSDQNSHGGVVSLARVSRGEGLAGKTNGGGETTVIDMLLSTQGEPETDEI